MLKYHVNYQKGYQLYGKYIGNWGDREVVYSFEAVNGNKVVNKIVLGESKELHLETKVSSTRLHENTSYDMASIRLRVLNQNNVQTYYYNEPFELSVEGPIELVGPNLVSFKGGMSGTYIKTLHKKGKAKLIIKTPFETKTIDFVVE
jgi:beta-galactosidase